MSHAAVVNYEAAVVSAGGTVQHGPAPVFASAWEAGAKDPPAPAPTRQWPKTPAQLSLPPRQPGGHEAVGEAIARYFSSALSRTSSRYAQEKRACCTINRHKGRPCVRYSRNRSRIRWWHEAALAGHRRSERSVSAACAQCEINAVASVIGWLESFRAARRSISCTDCSVKVGHPAGQAGSCTDEVVQVCSRA